MSAPQWFACYPTALLGALAGMSPEEGYTYTVLLLRIYEADGPVAETPRTLSRRTGLPERKITQALETLIQDGRVERLSSGHLDSPKTHEELDARAARRGQRSEAGKASAERRSVKVPRTGDIRGGATVEEKTVEHQRSASTGVASPLNARATGGQLDTVTVIETPSETSSLRDAGVPARIPAKPASERDQFAAILSASISPDRAAVIADHRKRQKWPLSEKAAQLMRDNFVACGDPNAGADLVILNGWRGFQADWLHRRQARAGPTGSRDAPPRLRGSDRLLSTMNGMFDDDQPATSAQPTLRLGAHQTADEA